MSGLPKFLQAHVAKKRSATQTSIPQGLARALGLRSPDDRRVDAVSRSCEPAHVSEPGAFSPLLKVGMTVSMRDDYGAIISFEPGRLVYWIDQNGAAHFSASHHLQRES